MNPNVNRLSRGLGRFGGRLASVVMLGGLVAIGIGWNGAAGVLDIRAQFPYLLSGGLIGLSLVVIGASLMLVQAHREDRARLEAKLDELIEAVGGSFAGSRAPQDLTGLVVAGSASFHVPGCRLVDGREEVAYLTPDEARARFLMPCRVCQPEPSNVTTL
ncbi:MAG: hypothetical protein QOE45_803 [Frankiaceae bacterium]|jgi:hypothetical protein|nr:hypothetical protein [Frankiaceae bacterium]